MASVQTSIMQYIPHTKHVHWIEHRALFLITRASPAVINWSRAKNNRIDANDGKNAELISVK